MTLHNNNGTFSIQGVEIDQRESQIVWNGWDLEELATEMYMSSDEDDICSDFEIYTKIVANSFNKRAELTKDKVYTEEDLEIAITHAYTSGQFKFSVVRQCILRRLNKLPVEITHIDDKGITHFKRVER